MYLFRGKLVYTVYYVKGGILLRLEIQVDEPMETKTIYN
jgi:hypothetical protein